MTCAFPHLYRALAQAGAEVLTVPAAFNDITGAAHWEALLRARAIETGCFVLAPAQTGFHAERTAAGRAAPMAIRWSSAPGARCWPMPAPSRASRYVDLDLAAVDRGARAASPR